MSTLTLPEGVQITADVSPEMAEILTPDALALVATLHRAFEPRRRELLQAARERVPTRLDAGELPDFLPETAGDPRRPDWKVAPAPADLQDRRVEITGPVDRKMIINALNSGAKVFMADFEDSQHAHLGEHDPGADQPARRGARRRSTFSSRRQGATRSTSNLATLLVRPRGWHLLREARPGRRRAGLRRHLRLRALHVPQRAEAARARARARTSTCPRWRATSRRGSGTTSSC